MTLSSTITEKTLRERELELKEKAIEKWDGALPSTLAGDNELLIGK